MQNPRIEELVRRDPRYPPEAYEFVFEALAYASKRLGRVRANDPLTPSPLAGESGEEEHVSVAEFFEGLRELALRDFGMMAPTVFSQWGVRRTDDFGEIVFNLIGAGLLDPTTADDRGAFHDHFDLGDGLVSGYEIDAGESLEESL